MVDLVKASTNEGVQHRSFNWAVCNARIRDLLEQIEKIKPLLDNADPDIPLRASQEIRDLHEQINKITELSKNSDIPRWERHTQRKRKKKAEKKERAAKKELEQLAPKPSNLFRPL